MKSTTWSKQILKKVLYSRQLNPLATALLKPFSAAFSEETLFRVPIFGTVTCRLPNAKKLYLASEGDDAIAAILYFKGVAGFESATIQLSLKLFEQANVVFDIGANTGIYALLAAIADERRMVYAFEPVPRIFERLQKNVALNQMHNLHVNASAVTNFDGTTQLYIPKGSVHIPTGSSTLAGFREAAEEVKASAITLDSFVKTQQILKIDLIKIDTENTEPWVLAGARETIVRDKPLIICEVLKGTTEPELHKVMDPLSYRYFWITERGLVEKTVIEGDGTYKNSNYLFVHTSAVDKIARFIVS
jgi:FkbM family methyltransferase